MGGLKAAAPRVSADHLLLRVLTYDARPAVVNLGVSYVALAVK